MVARRVGSINTGRDKPVPYARCNAWRHVGERVAGRPLVVARRVGSINTGRDKPSPTPLQCMATFRGVVGATLVVARVGPPTPVIAKTGRHKGVHEGSKPIQTRGRGCSVSNNAANCSVIAPPNCSASVIVTARR